MTSSSFSNPFGNVVSNSAKQVCVFNAASTEIRKDSKETKSESAANRFLGGFGQVEEESFSSLAGVPKFMRPAMDDVQYSLNGGISLQG
jgi:hypothetical protein